MRDERPLRDGCANFRESRRERDEVERPGSCGEIIEAAASADQSTARQCLSGLQANEMLNDLVTSMRQPVNANQIDARLVRLVPGIERTERVVADEPRGGKELCCVLV